MGGASVPGVRIPNPAAVWLQRRARVLAHRSRLRRRSLRRPWCLRTIQQLVLLQDHLLTCSGLTPPRVSSAYRIEPPQDLQAHAPAEHARAGSHSAGQARRTVAPFFTSRTEAPSSPAASSEVRDSYGSWPTSATELTPSSDRRRRPVRRRPNGSPPAAAPAAPPAAPSPPRAARRSAPTARTGPSERRRSCESSRRPRAATRKRVVPAGEERTFGIVGPAHEVPLLRDRVPDEIDVDHSAASVDASTGASGRAPRAPAGAPSKPSS